ncbi:MAG TPA: helix-turn-helix domain-containing protein [Acidothermaceae bacterium]
MRPHRIAILALDGVLPLDFGIPAHVFLPRLWLPYRTTVCAERPQVEVATGYSLVVPGTLADVRRADTVIVPGFVDHGRVFSDDVLDALRHVHRRRRRVVSICTGAFALAAAGLLDGLQATTHWRDIDELAERYPQILVDHNVLYIDNGQVLTSAGVASGIDLCLYIVRRDLGAAVANRLARLIVAAPHRDGGQTQFIEAPVGTTDGSLSATRSWALDHLRDPLSVRDLARHAGVSERTFARRFVDETGSPPLQWLLAARIQRARELIETADLSVDQVAHHCGMGTAANLRLHFRRFVGTTPTSYRKAFTAT